MELSELLTADAHNEGAEVEIKAPDGSKTDVKIHVMGKNSDEYQRQIMRGKHETLKLLGSDEDLAQKQIDFDIDTLVRVTKGWSNLVNDGKEVEFTQEACRNLYAKAPDIRRQVNDFVLHAVNFTKG